MAYQQNQQYGGYNQQYGGGYAPQEQPAQYYQQEQPAEQEKQARAGLYQKSEQQIKILNNWWKKKTRGGNIDKTLVDATEKAKLAQQANLPIKIVEYWLGNTRKKARKIARTEGKLPPSGGPSSKKPGKKKPASKKKKPAAKGKRGKREKLVQKTEQQLFILNSWWEQKVAGGNIDATLVDIEEKRALAQATGLELKVLDNWLGNTRKKARKAAAAGAGYM